MTLVHRTLRIAPSDEGVLGVVIGAPPMNLIGPELVHDLVMLIGALGSGQETSVMVLESADPDYFIPHVDLTKVDQYTAEAAKAGGPGGSTSWSPRTRPKLARPPCSRRACRPAARSNSTSATASEPFNGETDLIGGVDQPGELMPSGRGLRSAPLRISASCPDDWSGAQTEVYSHDRRHARDKQ